VAVALGEQSEGIDESCIHQILKTLALFIRKAFLAAIRLRVRNIRGNKAKNQWLETFVHDNPLCVFVGRP
jgi:hypothetical protein